MKLDNDPAKQPSSKVERGGKIRECTGLECTVQKAYANEGIQGELNVEGEPGEATFHQKE